MLPPSPSSMRAAATTPAEPAGAPVVHFPADGSLPRETGGSASALTVSRPAQRSLALRPTWSLSRPRRPFCRSASDDVVTSIIRSDCYRLERQLAGRDSHPLRDGAFSRHTVSSCLSRRNHPRAGGATPEAIGSYMAKYGPSPRGRGNPKAERERIVGQGPSPRGRGNPLHRGADVLRYGTIPARAGQPPRNPDVGVDPRDHPRAGGATRRACSGSWATWGPSPRGRGNLERYSARRRTPGTIPARAGQPRSSRQHVAARRDHPRAGGATSYTLTACPMLRGPSPRGRGNQYLRGAHPVPLGTIPARAGQPATHYRALAHSGDHPRAGGATAMKPDDGMLAKGPSPRGRGNHQRPRRDGQLLGTIPARAGQPPGAAAREGRIMDHPRAGGATAGLGAAMSMYQGPSPRGRGNPILVAVRRLVRGPSPRGRGNRVVGCGVPERIGTIPARAGQPGARRHGPGSRGDHPRAGGATRSSATVFARLDGPSPRGRGNLVKLVHHA